jgi:hypothetical protein
VQPHAALGRLSRSRVARSGATGGACAFHEGTSDKRGGVPWGQRRKSEGERSGGSALNLYTHTVMSYVVCRVRPAVVPRGTWWWCGGALAGVAASTWHMHMAAARAQRECEPAARWRIMHAVERGARVCACRPCLFTLQRLNKKKKIFCRFATLRHGDTSVPDGLSR